MRTDDDFDEMVQNDTSLAHGKTGPFWFDAGIYKDEGFFLFEIGMIEVSQAYPGKQITILHLHIGYFHLDFGWEMQP